MKDRVYALLIGTALSLATCGLSHAKSELISLSTVIVWLADKIKERLD